MRKIPRVIVLLLAVLLFATGCGNRAEQRGNSAANTSNRGYVAADGNTLYYRFGNAILREDNMGAVSTVCAKKADFLNFYDGLLYFVNLDDNNTLYSVKPDGTELTRISDIGAWYVSIVNGWIYFADRGSEGGIYKINIETGGLTRISEAIAQYVNVADGWVYYADLYNSGIYRMDTNGLRTTRISAEECASLNVVGKQIYYRSYTKIGLYRMNTDGTDVVKLNEQGASTIALYRGELYFSVYNDKTYQMTPDGKDLKDIYYERALTINAEGDWLFFHSIDCFRLVRYNLLTGETESSQDNSATAY